MVRAGAVAQVLHRALCIMHKPLGLIPGTPPPGKEGKEEDKISCTWIKMGEFSGV